MTHFISVDEFRPQDESGIEIGVAEASDSGVLQGLKRYHCLACAD